MVQPNSECIGFTDWMLNISKQHLSGPQRVLTLAIYNAAIGNYPVSDQDWYNFNLFAAWRNKFYLVFKDYAAYTNPTLLTDLVYAFNFEGSSVPDFGPVTTVDVGAVYGLPYGKINQGVNFPASGDYIATSGMPFTPLWSMNVWVNFDTFSALGGFFVAAGSLNSGFCHNAATGKFSIYQFGYNDSTATVYPNAWFMFSATFDGTTIRMYVNGVAAGSYNPVYTMYTTTLFGSPYSNYQLFGSLDAYGFWSRVLTPAEITSLWNGGAGLQYPF